jgi:hypothetical protein
MLFNSYNSVFPLPGPAVQYKFLLRFKIASEYDIVYHAGYAIVKSRYLYMKCLNIVDLTAKI